MAAAVLYGLHQIFTRLAADRVLPPVPQGRPLSAVPAILAGGAAIMAVAGVVAFREPPTVARLAGIVLALTGLFLLRK